MEPAILRRDADAGVVLVLTEMGSQWVPHSEGCAGLRNASPASLPMPSSSSLHQASAKPPSIASSTDFFRAVLGRCLRDHATILQDMFLGTLKAGEGARPATAMFRPGDDTNKKGTCLNPTAEDISSLLSSSSPPTPRPLNLEVKHYRDCSYVSARNRGVQLCFEDADSAAPPPTNNDEGEGNGARRAGGGERRRGMGDRRLASVHVFHKINEVGSSGFVTCPLALPFGLELGA